MEVISVKSKLKRRRTREQITRKPNPMMLGLCGPNNLLMIKAFSLTRQWFHRNDSENLTLTNDKTPHSTTSSMSSNLTHHFFFISTLLH